MGMCRQDARGAGLDADQSRGPAGAALRFTSSGGALGGAAAGALARPRALHTEEIFALVQRYAATAKVAIQAGFDGVQIHAAHGYLISQFLSPEANRRDDDYGGDLRRRQRFLLDVIQAVRTAVGPDIPVSVKLNSSDFSRSGLTPQEALHHVRALERTSVDLLEISGGSFHTAAMLGMAAPQTAAFTRESEGYFLEFARRARLVYSKPVMVTGGFRTASALNAAFASGVIDMAGIARPMVMDVNVANRLLRRHRRWFREHRTCARASSREGQRPAGGPRRNRLVYGADVAPQPEQAAGRKPGATARRLAIPHPTKCPARP